MSRRNKLRYQWFETSSYFGITDTVTGEDVVMGDGVDMLSYPSGRSIPVATPAFYKALDRMFRDSQDEIGEAYFGTSMY